MGLCCRSRELTHNTLICSPFEGLPLTFFPPPYLLNSFSHFHLMFRTCQTVKLRGPVWREPIITSLLAYSRLKRTDPGAPARSFELPGVPRGRPQTPQTRGQIFLSSSFSVTFFFLFVVSQRLFITPSVFHILYPIHVISLPFSCYHPSPHVSSSSSLFLSSCWLPASSPLVY